VSGIVDPRRSLRKHMFFKKSRNIYFCPRRKPFHIRLNREVYHAFKRLRDASGYKKVNEAPAFNGRRKVRIKLIFGQHPNTLTRKLNLIQPTVSQHLGNLENAGVVRQKGRQMGLLRNRQLRLQKITSDEAVKLKPRLYFASS